MAVIETVYLLPKAFSSARSWPRTDMMPHVLGLQAHTGISTTVWRVTRRGRHVSHLGLLHHPCATAIGSVHQRGGDPWPSLAMIYYYYCVLRVANHLATFASVSGDDGRAAAGRRRGCVLGHAVLLSRELHFERDGAGGVKLTAAEQGLITARLVGIR